MFDPIVDISFIIDIVINFNTGFVRETEAGSEYFTSRKAIAKNYMKGWFFLDIFSCMPIDYISNYGANELAKIMRVSKLQKLFKLLKIPRFLKIFQVKERM